MSPEAWENVYALMWAAAAVLAAGLLVTLAVTSWLLNLVGLPGNWIVLALAALYAWLIPASWRGDFGWRWLVALAVLATVGELLEFLASALGTQHAGGSRRSAVGALIGSMIGGIVGATVALPIPVVGPVIGALLMGGIGAAVGAVVGELSAGGESRRSWEIGHAAFWGRLLGTGAKTLMGAVMVALLVVALIV